MKIFECTKDFKSALFSDGNTERIEIKKGSIWFLSTTNKKNGRVVLSNNKIELDIADKILDTHFQLFCQ